MKKFKRIIVAFIVSLLSILSFVGCDRGRDFAYDVEMLKERVVSVEIVFFPFDRFYYEPLYFGHQYEQLYLFSDEEKDEFLEEFCQLKLCEGVSPPRTPYEYNIRLLFDDGCVHFVGDGGLRIDAQGGFVSWSPRIREGSLRDFYRLLSKYIELGEKYQKYLQ